MNLCNIHSQWYTTYCVYCGKPGESKIQNLQVSEPFVMKLTKEQWEQFNNILNELPTFNQELHDLLNLRRNSNE